TADHLCLYTFCYLITPRQTRSTLFPYTTLFRSLVCEDRQFVASNQAGIEISAMKLDKGDLLLRLFNAEGVSGVQHIMLDFPVEGIEEVLLNGEKVSALKVADHMSKPTFSMDIHRFGIKTVRRMKKSISLIMHRC